MKSARIGFSFATAVEAMLDCIEHKDGGTTWTVLSASKAQSNEFVEAAQKILQAIGAVGQLYEEPFVDIEGESTITQSRIQIGGARIIALPANPRTARGYPGNAILDEFGHHEESYAIWAAVTRQVALGHKLRVLSTPAGEQGKFFDLAREFGLADGIEPPVNPLRKGDWSWHWVDVNLAVAEGCPINPTAMRDLIQDADTYAQEFLCVFLQAKGAWLPLELIALAEDDGAWIDWPANYSTRLPLYAGADVARDHDATLLWLDERIGDVSWTRLVLPLYAMPFPQQARTLAPWVQMTARTAIDSTGMGVALYDLLEEACPGRVMGVNFGGSSEQGVKMKVDLAIRLKKRMEQGRCRLPHDLQIRQELQAIKRESTATGVRFEAPRIEVVDPSGAGRKKLYAHADRFWAKALAEFAADVAGVSTAFTASVGQQVHTQMGAYCG